MRSDYQNVIPSLFSKPAALSIPFPDIQSLGHDNKSDLVEEVLMLMAREKHSPEVSERNRVDIFI